MSKAGAKPNSKGGTWIKSSFVLAAITLAWAGANTPPDFSAANTAIWITGTFTIALLSKAAIAIIEPIITGLLRLSRKQMREAQRAKAAAKPQ